MILFVFSCNVLIMKEHQPNSFIEENAIKSSFCCEIESLLASFRH